MGATINMYRTGGVRVITFGGILVGKMAAYEGSKDWDDAFELARQLNFTITSAFGYSGPLAK